MFRNRQGLRRYGISDRYRAMKQDCIPGFEDGIWACDRCGWPFHEKTVAILEGGGTVHRTCLFDTDDVPSEGTQNIVGIHGPGLFRKIANFSIASIGHVMRGSPTCTQLEIDNRHDVCRSCELYEPSKTNPEVGICTHSDCGCPVTRADKYITKLGWRDQSCPLGKWKTLS